MKNRIKRLRNDVGLTQQQFAVKIGVSQNTFANYEIGRRNPSNSAINNICKTFKVNEKWLRTGVGDMYEPDEKFCLDDLVKENNGTPQDIRIIKAYFKLPVEVRREVFEWMRQAAGSEDEAELSGTDPALQQIPVPRQAAASGDVPPADPVPLSDPVRDAEEAYIKSRSGNVLRPERSALNIGEDVAE